MAHINKTKNSKFRAQIQRNGTRQSKVFDSHEEASAWAEKTETRILKRKKLLRLVDGVDGQSSEIRGLLPSRVIRALSDVPYMHDEIVNAAIPCKSLVGVYFLIEEGQVVYVGQSTDMLRRISRHRDNDILFDSFTVIFCSKDKIDEIESMYIDAFLPKYNRATPSVVFKKQKQSLVK
jgi:hypothetical protein